MKKQHVQEATKELHALVDDFCEQWLRGHESDKPNWPLKMPEGEWWDQFLMYAQAERGKSA